SKRRHFKEVEPRLATRILIRKMPKSECGNPRETRMSKSENSAGSKILDFGISSFEVSFGFRGLGFSDFLSLQPLPQHCQSLVGSRYHLHADHLPYLRSGRSAGICCRFNRRDIPAEESRHITAADFFPADPRY